VECNNEDYVLAKSFHLVIMLGLEQLVQHLGVAKGKRLSAKLGVSAIAVCSLMASTKSGMGRPRPNSFLSKRMLQYGLVHFNVLEFLDMPAQK
jgi:hypothetical protein